MGGLKDTKDGAALTLANGKIEVIDGPYAESKEVMGGFWIIEVADLDAALDWARRGSAACEGPVEVRPFQDG
jgi:hypothetical protein